MRCAVVNHGFGFYPIEFDGEAKHDDDFATISATRCARRAFLYQEQNRIFSLLNITLN